MHNVLPNTRRDLVEIGAKHLACPDGVRLSENDNESLYFGPNEAVFVCKDHWNDEDERDNGLLRLLRMQGHVVEHQS